ncbi:adenosylcobinamide-phosphate synthase CbiB [Polaromonas sp. YR568]|uniref:adenosylcobinamide-phosphate synthase CbiB n=1 Tax=Polaromonas sp. YR568 TaxID=1855301 RepID=UPI003137DD61
MTEITTVPWLDAVLPLSVAGGAAGVSAAVLLLAWWIDRQFGEPLTAIHPVVWMGRFLKVCGDGVVRCSPAPAFVLGALAWCVGAVAVATVAWGLQGLVLWQVGQALAAADMLLAALAALLVLLAGWALKCMLSWRMLHDEAGAVETALQQSLAAGRERLSWLVSRDTAQLTDSQVRESAIESLAENLNDSVVAPIFWFVLLGLPGAAVYRFANTADAMWGYRGTYRGQHWEWAGKWAARADDVLSWVPARVTALLLMAVTRGVRLSAVLAEAQKTPSPNSGWPMAAMALALGISLGKPGVYTLNPSGRPPGPDDVAAAQADAGKAVVLLLIGAVTAIFLAAAMGGSWPGSRA